MEEKHPWIKYVTMEDIPNDDLRVFTEKVGIEKAVETILELPGIGFVIPKKPFRRAKERYIMENYDGTKYSIDKLALACDYTAKQIYQIIKRYREKQRLKNK